MILQWNVWNVSISSTRFYLSFSLYYYFSLRYDLGFLASCNKSIKLIQVTVRKVYPRDS